jgi:hypothetical protein
VIGLWYLSKFIISYRINAEVLQAPYPGHILVIKYIAKLYLNIFLNNPICGKQINRTDYTRSAVLLVYDKSGDQYPSRISIEKCFAFQKNNSDFYVQLILFHFSDFIVTCIYDFGIQEL